jgi:DNA-binding transcriptional LysR family regulator
MGRRAFASSAGRDLIEHAARLLREAEEAAAAMRRHREGRMGRVRLSANDIFCSYLLPRAIQTFRKRAPEAEILVGISSTSNVIGQVLENHVDLGVVTLPVANASLSVTPILAEPLVAILPPAEKRVPPRIGAADLARHKLILDLPTAKYARLVRSWFEANGVEPKPVMETSAYESTKRLVAAGLAASILPHVATETPSRHRFVIRRLKPELKWELAVVARRDKPMDGAVAEMRDALLTLRRR